MTRSSDDYVPGVSYKPPPKTLMVVLAIGSLSAVVGAFIAYATWGNVDTAKREDIEQTQQLIADVHALFENADARSYAGDLRRERLMACAIQLILDHDRRLGVPAPQVQGNACEGLVVDATGPAPPAAAPPTTIRKRTTTTRPRARSTTSRPGTTQPPPTDRPPETTSTTVCPTALVEGTCITA